MGKIVLEPQAFEPEALPEDVLMRAWPRCSQAARAVVPARSRRICLGMADATRLRQVLVNIIRERGQIHRIGAKCLVTIDRPARDRFAHGARHCIGMSATQTRSIFDPFTQADASTTRRFGWHWAGLAISQRLWC